MTHNLSSEEREILVDFVSESIDVMDQVDQMLLMFESGDISDSQQSLVDHMFRLFHSLKGAAGFLELINIQNFTHKVEDVLQIFREKPTLLQSNHIDLFFACGDLLRNMLMQVENEFHDQGFEDQAEALVDILESYLSDPNGALKPLPSKEAPPAPQAIQAPPHPEAPKVEVPQAPLVPQPSVSPPTPSSPVKSVTPAAAPATTPKAPKATAATETRDKKLSKILYIDDANELQDLVRDYFEEEHQVEVVGATEENMGLQLAELVNPDLILLDIMMPTYGRDGGFEVLKQLKSNDALKHIPVIMFTARIDHGTAIQALDLGADDFERKPFDLERLVEKIHYCYSRYEKQESQKNQKQAVIEKISDRVRQSEVEVQRRIRRNFFLEILIDFYENSNRCNTVTSLLDLLISTTQSLTWNCTATLTHKEKEIYRSDYMDNEIGGFIIRELKKGDELTVSEESFLFVMTKTKNFSLLIRNAKAILNPPVKAAYKPKEGELIRDAKELLRAFMSRYQCLS